jgi:hypothetical protein
MGRKYFLLLNSSLNIILVKVSITLGANNCMPDIMREGALLGKLLACVLQQPISVLVLEHIALLREL